MAISERVVDYDGPGGTFEATLVWNGAALPPRPGVVLFPNLLGTKPSDIDYARRLAANGCAVFVADLYRKGERPGGDRTQAYAFMDTLNADRQLLQGRTLAALAASRAQPEVDAGRVAAVGFCFGGKCALDLARSGADVAGVASLHGVYDPPPFATSPIAAKVLVLHGWDDHLSPPDQTVALAAELTAAGANWQIHAYGHTGHAFTDRHAADGTMYRADADRRSWQALGNFLAELW